MRKYLILALLTISLAGYTQRTYPGVNIGLNIASFTADSTILDKSAPRYGMNLGLIWDMYMNEDTYFQFGVMFSQQGVKYYSEYFYQGLFNKDMVLHKVDYLIFPLIWKQRWSSIYTQIGGYLGIIPLKPKSTWYKYVYFPDSISVESGVYNSFTSNISFFDVGPVFGLGYQVKLNQQFDVFLQFNYRPGLVKVNKEYTRPIYQMKNQVFSVSVGLISIGAVSRHNRFVLKRKR